MTIGSHSSADLPLTGQKQKAATASTSPSAAQSPAPLGSVRNRTTAAARLTAIGITCVARSDPMRPRRSSGPKRYLLISLSGIGQFPTRGGRGGSCRGGGGDADPPRAGGGGATVERLGGEPPLSRDGADGPRPLS